MPLLILLRRPPTDPGQAVSAIPGGGDTVKNVTGKLIVQCTGAVKTPPWVFYLHGDASTSSG